MREIAKIEFQLVSLRNYVLIYSHSIFKLTRAVPTMAISTAVGTTLNTRALSIKLIPL